MMPSIDITKWSISHPWSTRVQVEQDLLLSQAICEIANDEALKDELIIRGGTAYHKLFLPKPFRYSEDLDYVRTSKGAIGHILDRLTLIGDNLGYKTSTRISQHPKVFWKCISESGLPIRIKIEINTYERTPVLPVDIVTYKINVDSYSSIAHIKTFQVNELIATKIRALYQRSKGRDLFDLWLALEVLKLSPIKIVNAFKPYRPEGLTSDHAIENLEQKLTNRQFLEDLHGLTILNEIDYDSKKAGDIVIEKLLCLLW